MKGLLARGSMRTLVSSRARLTANNAPREFVDFGFSRVSAEEKPRLVGNVFENVASKYDLMNDLMSGGMHRLWKKIFVARMNPAHDTMLLDVAGGTGDIAKLFIDHVTQNTPASVVASEQATARVRVVDINPHMISVARQKKCFAPYICPETQDSAEKCAETQKPTERRFPTVSFEVGDAENLNHVADASVDMYSITFGIRNCTHYDRVLREAYRVLKPGGRIMVMEFGKVNGPAPLRKLYQTYSFRVIPAIGHIVAGNRDAYQYLVESIERFPSQQEFSSLLREAGFYVPQPGYENLTCGVAAIWSAWKL